MNLSDTPEEGYRDLLRRAEEYFRSLGSRKHLPFGIARWLDDLDYIRTRELLETTVAESDEIDVPL